MARTIQYPVRAQPVFISTEGITLDKWIREPGNPTRRVPSVANHPFHAIPQADSLAATIVPDLPWYQPASQPVRPPVRAAHEQRTDALGATLFPPGESSGWPAPTGQPVLPPARGQDYRVHVWEPSLLEAPPSLSWRAPVPGPPAPRRALQIPQDSFPAPRLDVWRELWPDPPGNPVLRRRIVHSLPADPGLWVPPETVTGWYQPASQPVRPPVQAQPGRTAQNLEQTLLVTASPIAWLQSGGIVVLATPRQQLLPAALDTIEDPIVTVDGWQRATSQPVLPRKRIPLPGDIVVPLGYTVYPDSYQREPGRTPASYRRSQPEHPAIAGDMLRDMVLSTSWDRPASQPVLPPVRWPWYGTAEMVGAWTSTAPYPDRWWIAQPERVPGATRPAQSDQVVPLSFQVSEALWTHAATPTLRPVQAQLPDGGGQIASWWWQSEWPVGWYLPPDNPTLRTPRPSPYPGADASLLGWQAGLEVWPVLLTPTLPTALPDGSATGECRPTFPAWDGLVSAWYVQPGEPVRIAPGRPHEGLVAFQPILVNYSFVAIAGTWRGPDPGQTWRGEER